MTLSGQPEGKLFATECWILYTSSEGGQNFKYTPILWIYCKTLSFSLSKKWYPMYKLANQFEMVNVSNYSNTFFKQM